MYFSCISRVPSHFRLLNLGLGDTSDENINKCYTKNIDSLFALCCRADDNINEIFTFSFRLRVCVSVRTTQLCIHCQLFTIFEFDMNKRFFFSSL